MAEESRQQERRGACEAHHVHAISGVAEHERSALAGPQPQALFAEGKRILAELHPRINIERIEPIDGVDWSRRLHWVVIHLGDQRLLSGGRRGTPGCMLILASRIPEEAPVYCTHRGSAIEAASLIVGPPKIVPDGLAEVETVTQRAAGDVCVAAVNGVDGERLIALALVLKLVA